MSTPEQALTAAHDAQGAADARPAETANWDWRESEVAATVAQLGQAQSEHMKAMELPAVPDRESKHTGGSDAGYPA